MKNVVFVTGNAGKAHYFSQLVGLEVEHHDADVDEIQSLNLKEIAAHKAKMAYDQLKKPVIVEDTSLIIKSLGKLPGPFIKWFEVELGLEGICRLADIEKDRSAEASNVHVYYDGNQFKYFAGQQAGSISEHPMGAGGFGFNPIFIPSGSQKTMAEMSDAEFKTVYLKFKKITELGKFLKSL